MVAVPAGQGGNLQLIKIITPLNLLEKIKTTPSPLSTRPRPVGLQRLKLRPPQTRLKDKVLGRGRRLRVVSRVFRLPEVTLSTTSRLLTARPTSSLVSSPSADVTVARLTVVPSPIVCTEASTARRLSVVLPRHYKAKGFPLTAQFGNRKHLHVVRPAALIAAGRNA